MSEKKISVNFIISWKLKEDPKNIKKQSSKTQQNISYGAKTYAL